MKRLVTTAKTRLRYIAVPYFRLNQDRYIPVVGEGVFDLTFDSTFN